MGRRAFFASDLHMFARRSSADSYVDEILQAARDADLFVLGGDIFDFKWTTMSSVEETVEAAIAWLHELIDPCPDCEFHFILGNHDATPRFIESLGDFSQQHQHFSWHRYYVRVGPCLFLHGDIADGEQDHARLDVRRERWDVESPRSRRSHAMYDLAVKMNLHRIAGSIAHRERAVLRNVLTYAERIGHGSAAGVTDVYFGHIHRILDGVEFGSLTFHNGGAAIRGNEFRIIEFKLP